MDAMDSYRLAQDGFDAMLAAVPAGGWDKPSACAQWTVRDVAGHVIWGQHQLRAWATGEPYESSQGAPGSPHPAEVAGDDPVAAWRAARAATRAAMTDDGLGRMVTLPVIGEVPVFALVPLAITDQVTHTWDIGHPLGMTVRLDRGLVDLAFDWARANVVRRPGFFDAQTRLLAFLGRAA
jgi:uncharacterized protein (TIGR03086 family)